MACEASRLECYPRTACFWEQVQGEEQVASRGQEVSDPTRVKSLVSMAQLAQSLLVLLFP